MAKTTGTEPKTIKKESNKFRPKKLSKAVQAEMMEEIALKTKGVSNGQKKTKITFDIKRKYRTLYGK